MEISEKLHKNALDEEHFFDDFSRVRHSSRVVDDFCHSVEELSDKPSVGRGSDRATHLDRRCRSVLDARHVGHL